MDGWSCSEVCWGESVMEEVCLGLAIDVEAGICRDYLEHEGLWVLWKASVAQNRTEPSLLSVH